MKTLIIYFSGSGNSYAIAKKLAEKLGKTVVVPVKKHNEKKIGEFDRIGFVFPVYSIHAPKFLMEALKTIKFQGQQIFLVATHAGSKGYAVSELRSIIAENKISNLQEFRVRMPGSGILEYGAFPDRIQKFLLKRSENRVIKITKAINKNQKTKRIRANLLAVLFKKDGDKRFHNYTEKGKLFYNDEKCNSCGMCMKICPAQNISMRNNKPYWGGNCQQCMACIQWCPTDAVKHPDLKEGRKKYHHPEISLQNFLSEIK